jgi:DNA polymerase
MGVPVWAPEARMPRADAPVQPAEAAATAMPSLPPALVDEAVAVAGKPGEGTAGVQEQGVPASPAPAVPVEPRVAPRDELATEHSFDGVSGQDVEKENGVSPIPHPALPASTQAGELAQQGLGALAPITRVDPAQVAQLDWPELQATVARCHACRLCESRRQTVFGVGAHRADWLVVGEAPGEQEDRRGEPFVGPAGQLLDAMLSAVGVSRQAPAGEQAVYIANVLKCRPPGNRNPAPDEVAQCEPYLRRQVALLQPKIILALGRFAVQSLLNTTEPIGRLRQQVHQYQGVPVIVSYHPAYLLRNLPDKSKAWADLVLAMKVAGRLKP